MSNQGRRAPARKVIPLTRYGGVAGSDSNRIITHLQNCYIPPPPGDYTAPTDRESMKNGLWWIAWYANEMFRLPQRIEKEVMDLFCHAYEVRRGLVDGWGQKD